MNLAKTPTLEQWARMSRYDLKMIPIMRAEGWEVVFSPMDIVNNRITPSDPPHNFVYFKKGEIKTWMVRDKWRVGSLLWNIQKDEVPDFKNLDDLIKSKQF